MDALALRLRLIVNRASDPAFAFAFIYLLGGSDR
jgi:hypothetical protein